MKHVTFSPKRLIAAVLAATTISVSLAIVDASAGQASAAPDPQDRGVWAMLAIGHVPHDAVHDYGVARGHQAGCW